MDSELYFRAAFQPLTQWYLPIIFTFLGSSLALISLHHYLDMMQDRFGTNFRQKEDVFDFIVGNVQNS